MSNKEELPQPFGLEIKACRLDGRNVAGQLTFDAPSERVSIQVASLHHRSDHVLVTDTNGQSYMLDRDQSVYSTRLQADQHLFHILAALNNIQDELERD